MGYKNWIRSTATAHLKRWRPAVECLWQSPSGSGHTSPCPAPGSTGSALQAVHKNVILIEDYLTFLKYRYCNYQYLYPVLLPVPVPSVVKTNQDLIGSFRLLVEGGTTLPPLRARDSHLPMKEEKEKTCTTKSGGKKKLNQLLPNFANFP